MQNSNLMEYIMRPDADLQMLASIGRDHPELRSAIGAAPACTQQLRDYLEELDAWDLTHGKDRAHGKDLAQGNEQPTTGSRPDGVSGGGSDFDDEDDAVTAQIPVVRQPMPPVAQQPDLPPAPPSDSPDAGAGAQPAGKSRGLLIGLVAAGVVVVLGVVFGILAAVGVFGSNADQQAAQVSATQSSSSASAESTGRASCPSGTRTASWGTWHDGWVVICEESSGTLTEMMVKGIKDSAGVETTKTVKHGDSSSGDCGTLSGGRTACFYFSPGTLVVDDSAGDRQQIGFSKSWQRGASSSGTGAYGVKAPSASAQSQVNYLVSILDRSQGARQSLQPAVTTFQQCTSADFPSAMSTINTIVQNRQDLLSAVNSAPVDQISNGSQVTSELSAALQNSLNADLAYQSWAQAIEGQGCGAGADSFAQAGSYSSASTQTKQTFTATWNQTIAPVYGVATVNETTI